MSIDYSKCRICKEKDHTNKMIMPCKCGTWVHRSCLNKKRVSDPAYYESCPICGATYNFEFKKMPEWKKHFQIISSVILDVISICSMFALSSFILGKLFITFNIKSELIPNPTLFGGAIICGIIGFCIIIYAMSQGGFFYFYPSNFYSGNNNNDALMAFVVIGIVAVFASLIYYTYYITKSRYERHRRAVGVKENVVTDYLKGVDKI
ncbi:hypothetical protein TRFO_04165 [Tritrichomonas foetus]|uniref:Uncharacterized protein n=1 Tax=Tritrichomonas foetus TaxID=1144522 RepID=A0A1J4KGX1_9EUKA|nr:hypothetical protein TRFO_04165 [Tritrichomonas foetus]|eukprot:OHT10663.1 hypothetical protein TRFO_04165 [Tritrichomonas foetus]